MTRILIIAIAVLLAALGVAGFALKAAIESKGELQETAKQQIAVITRQAEQIKQAEQDRKALGKALSTRDTERKSHEQAATAVKNAVRVESQGSKNTGDCITRRVPIGIVRELQQQASHYRGDGKAKDTAPPTQRVSATWVP